MSSSDAYSVPHVNDSGIYQAEYTGGPPAPQPGGGVKGKGAASAGPSPGFQVDSAGVRSQAAALDRCAGEAAQVLSRLRDSLEAAGMPWGTDDMGKKFGHGYTGPANQGFGSIAGLPAALASVASELVNQANGYDVLEQRIVDALTSTGKREIVDGQGNNAAGSPAASA